MINFNASPKGVRRQEALVESVKTTDGYGNENVVPVKRSTDGERGGKS